MVSEKKGSIPVTARKPQGSSSRPPMKQRTLFDSFLTKPVVNVDPEPLVPSPVVNLPFATPNAPLDKQENTTPQEVDIEISVDKSLAEDHLEKPFTVSDTSLIGVPPKRERSPSVVLVEEISEISLKPSTHVTEKERLTLQLGDSKSDGKSLDQPIVIPSSPMEGPAATYPRLNKPIHPFFQPKSKTTAPRVPQVPKQSWTVHPAHVAPYPSIQHTRGPQTSALDTPTPLTMFPRRTVPRQTPHSDNPASYKFLSRSTNVENELGNPWTYLTPGNSSRNGHELGDPLSSPVMLDGQPTSRRPWSEKWRPSCAEEVLGNEISSVYLRNWLRALELQLEDNTAPTTDAVVETVKGKSKPSGRGTKRVRVVRAVDKTRRKKSRLDSDEEDNWIVNTDDESDDEVETYSEFDAFGEPFPSLPASSPTAHIPDTEPSQCQDLGQLHNTILLSGPHGTGKTASVYACAEELGWDVFEVYPGIGRRNGANVDNLVGEVGKNHLVNQNRQSGEVLKSFFRHKSNPEVGDTELSSAPVYSPRKKASPAVASETITKDRMRQSLILLEEVDILFKEDTNFWTTVTRIIKECKRPVICTCNDLSLVPIGDLPLQTVLHFSPSLPEVATPYLQSLCLAEGYSLNADNITQLHLNPWKHSAKDLSTYPSSTGDLRRTINALQVACLTLNVSRPEAQSTSELTPHDVDDAQDKIASTFSDQCADNRARISAKAIEAKSYIDGVLGGDSPRFFATRDLASHLPSEDDEIGHVILRDVHAQDPAQLGLNDRHEEIVSTAIQLSRGEFDVDAMISVEETRRKMGDGQRLVLHELCPPSTWSRADGLVEMDYLAYIRQIVKAEDREEMEQEKRRQGGRNTRNSARSGYVRTLGLTEEARRVVLGA